MYFVLHLWYHTIQTNDTITITIKIISTVLSLPAGDVLSEARGW
jgi:hypothetical protein